MDAVCRDGEPRGVVAVLTLQREDGGSEARSARQQLQRQADGGNAANPIALPRLRMRSP
jgi:hypothetical protein